MDDVVKIASTSVAIVENTVRNLPKPSQETIDDIIKYITKSLCICGIIGTTAGAAVYVSNHCDFEAQYKDCKVKISR